MPSYYPWIYPEHEVEAQVCYLLRQTYFTKVKYTGTVRFIDHTYIRHEAEFFDEENNTWDVPSEYISGSTIKKLMNEIVSIFVDHDEEEDCEIWLEDSEISSSSESLKREE